MHARSRSVVGVLALLVVTAGCVSAPTGGAPHETPLDAETVAADHWSVFANAGTYTVTANSTATLGGQRMGTSTVWAAIDRPANRANLTVDTAIGQVDTYVDGGRVYQRVGETDPQYRVVERHVNVSRIVRPDLVATVENYTFEANGTATVNGQEVWVYEANQTGENATLVRDLGANVLTVAVDVTLYVREDGLVVRRVSNATIAANDGALTGTFVRTTTYSGIGTTTVDRPSWVEAAANATTG
ncbi:MAG: hypothetical protein ABEJ76_08650 [Halanaeroarchaeum sp.]